MTFSIIALFLFIFVIVIVISAVSIMIFKNVKKEDNEKLNGGEVFEKKVRTIYFYLIMIILICIFTYSFISLFNNLMNILLPENISETLQSAEIAKNSEINNFIISVTGIIITLPMFWYCNRKIKENNK
jgi:cytochrome bd-type quinol oxidase subunit 2